MRRAVQGFIAALRRRGIQISPAERIDASHAVMAVGVESKEALRAALRAALAKNRDDVRLFEEVFGAYFASPRRVSGGRVREGPDGSGAGGRGGQGPGEGAGSRREPPREPGRAVKRREIRPERRGGRSEAAVGEGKAGPPGTRVPRPGGVQRPTRIMAADGRRIDSRSTTPPARPQAPAATREPPPRRREFVRWFTTEEEALLAREIPAIIQQIRLRRGRRFARGPRGRLWVKRMIRESLAHGGVPFTLPMKERRPRAPRVVLVVDVSHSVARAAALFLLICAGVSERLGRFEVYFFVDRVAEGTDLVRAWVSGRGRPAPEGRLMESPALAAAPPGRRGIPAAGITPRSGGVDFARLLAGLPEMNLMAPSDYGRAFFHARSVLSGSGGRDTVLVVLGDARTNRRDPLVWAFEEIAGRCRRVLWLNPEPRRLWDTEDSVMGAYLPACDVVCECRDLEGLSHGVREILRSL